MWGANKNGVPFLTTLYFIPIASALPSLIKGEVGRGLPLGIKLDHHIECCRPHPGI